MRLILVRHAQSTANLTEALDTRAPGAELTARGQQQRLMIASVLAAEPVDAVYASPFARTVCTAAAIAEPHGVKVVEHDGLREVSSGQLEMRTDAAARALYDTTVWNYAIGYEEVLVPGGESRADVLARFGSVVDEASRAADRCAVVVTHGAIVRAWCGARVHRLEPADIFADRLPNTGRVVLERRFDGEWEAHSWNGRPVR